MWGVAGTFLYRREMESEILCFGNGMTASVNIHVGPVTKIPPLHSK